MSLKSQAAIAVATMFLIAAPQAWASGPGNIPFGNGSGGGAQSGSQSGSGAGGSSSAPQGGGGGATVTRSCTIGTFANSTALVGELGNFQAAIATQFAVPIGCPIGSFWRLQYFNLTTGQMEFMDFASTGLNDTGGGSKGFTAGTSGTEVYSSAAFNTPYRVHMEIDDVNHNVLAQQDATIVTPPAP
jgi:hypothetical protein